jgi:hypothetical protein
MLVGKVVGLLHAVVGLPELVREPLDDAFLEKKELAISEPSNVWKISW